MLKTTLPNRLRIRTFFRMSGLFAVFALIMVNKTIGQTKTSTSKKEATTTIEEVIHFQRSSILVGDLERSLSVYKDILGFAVTAVGESDKASYAYTVFKLPKGANIRIATLNSTDQKRIINLKEVTGVELPKPASEPFMSAILIRVSDLKSIMKKIEDMGLESTEEHIVRGTRISYKEQSFIDPDGHLVALYELL